MAFEQAVLKNGEVRKDYIRRRFSEGAKPVEILKEINGQALYTGPVGSSWGHAIVSVALKGYVPPAKPAEEPPAGELRSTAAEKQVVPVSSESLLDDAEIAAIEAQARDEIRAELKAQKKKELLGKAKEKVRAELAIEAGTNEQMVTVSINLAPFCDRIHIDMPYGPVYMHGRTYTVPLRRAQGILEACYRTWKHEDMRKGIPALEQSSRNLAISAKTGAVSGNLAGVDLHKLPGF